MKYDYLVIGAGAAGLAFTALMEKKLQGSGKTIALLEAHSLPGGCSSYFERDGFVFDAGATTLSGLKPGRPLSDLIAELDLDLELIKIDPGIVSLFPNKKIHHYSDPNEWINELDSHFPEIENKKIWDKIFKISNEGWKVSSRFSQFPLKSWSELGKLLNLNTIRALPVLPYLLSSVQDTLNLNSLPNEDYKELINELLFITAQNQMQTTPMLMGAMGLTYPDDTYYAKGGMKAFVKALEAKCSHLYLKHKVLSIQKTNDGFTVKTNRETFFCHTLISSLPSFNHNELFNEKIFETKEAEDCWSAFMLYFTVPKDFNREGVYFQVHCDPIPYCNSKSFFVSLSHPTDQLRSHLGPHERQTVTISCHTRSNEWFNLSTDDYKAKKKVVEEYILRLFCERFNLERFEIQNVLTGSPKTFKRYTHRYEGLVGGIPHSIRRNPLTYLRQTTPFKNFYLIGDTQFPGQGIGAVVLGAQNLVKKLIL